jgi:hypothetical protein
MNDAKLLINFIIDLQDKQPFDLGDYYKILPIPLKENFIVTDIKGKDKTDELIKTIVDWENYKFYGTLEKLLKEKYNIQKR